MESPVSQRYYSSSRSAQGNPRQENPQISINSNLPSTSSTTLNHSQSVDGANSINSNARSNIMFTNSNSMNSNAANDNGIECCAVYDAEISEETTNGNLEAPSINSALQQSISAIRSNMSPHATHSINSANNCQNTDHTQNSEIQPQCQLSQDNVLHRTQTQPRILSNGSTGSRAILSNGVVISPPPYCDVISTAARLPSVVVSGPSRPPSRRILFSLWTVFNVWCIFMKKNFKCYGYAFACTCILHVNGPGGTIFDGIIFCWKMRQYEMKSRILV